VREPQQEQQVREPQREQQQRVREQQQGQRRVQQELRRQVQVQVQQRQVQVQQRQAPRQVQAQLRSRHHSRQPPWRGSKPNRASIDQRCSSRHRLTRCASCQWFAHQRRQRQTQQPTRLPIC
jgi:hypothetical protein